MRGECKPTGRKAAGIARWTRRLVAVTPRLTALGLYGSYTSRPAVRPRALHAGRGDWWRFTPRLTALGLYGSYTSRPAV